jgi:very-short-patch-repair endonuclease
MKELKRLYIDEKMSSIAIASRFECTYATICKWLHEYDIPTRTASEAKRLDMERWSREDRLRITAASRRLITGKKRSHNDLCKRAKGKQRTARMSEYEKALFEKLSALGYKPIPLFALDKFNIDLAFPELKLGIEVDGGNWHKTTRIKIAQDTAKADMLNSLGWRIIRVKTRRQDWLPIAVSSIMPSLR